jgi:hypothetical protein
LVPHVDLAFGKNVCYHFSVYSKISSKDIGGAMGLAQHIHND